MASNSGRRSGSSGHSTPRKRVVIGAAETVRVRYDNNQPKVESERKGGRTRSQSTSARTSQPRKKSSSQGRRLSNAKREERERRQKMLRIKRVAAAVAAVGAVVGLVWAIVAIYTAPIFVIDRVVVTGNDHLDKASVLASAAVPPKATLVRVPLGAIEKRLDANPWVKEVRLTKDYPDTLRVEIVEREPALAIDAGGKEIWVISKDGHWLGLRSAEDTGLVSVLDLPAVEPQQGRAAESPELRNAIRVYWGISQGLRDQVRAVSAPSVEKTALLTKDDIDIFIGEATDLADKDRIVREILSREAGKVVYINVRVVEKPTWRGLNQSP